MQSRAAVLILPMLALLAGCHVKVTDKDGAGEDVSVAVQGRDDGGRGSQVAVKDADGKTVIATAGQGLSIDAPGFSGKLNLPGLNVTGDAIDLDGMKLYPGTKVTGVAVDAQDGDKGTVRISFTSAAAPEKIVDYYRTAASDAGYRVTSGGASDTALSGSKGGGKRFALNVVPGAGAANGTIVMSGS